jgi:hypothetical protein
VKIVVQIIFLEFVTVPVPLKMSKDGVKFVMDIPVTKTAEKLALNTRDVGRLRTAILICGQVDSL